MSVTLKNPQDVDGWLLEQLQFCQEHALDAVLQVANDYELVILGQERLYARRDSSLPASVRKILPAGYRHKTMGDNPELRRWALDCGRPLEELVWNCAYGMAVDGLLPGCRRDDVVQLRQWPNLTRLNAGKQGVRLAALLSSRPTSLVLASRILDMEEREVFRFYSACKYAGMIHTVNRAEAPVVAHRREHKNITLIRRLFSHLSQMAHA